MSEHLLSVKDLRTSFVTDNGEVHAVNGVSFNLDRGKVLGIVGESGSGKSVTAYSIMQILADNGRIAGVGFEGPEGEEKMDCDILLSSMPLKDLVMGMEKGGTPVPDHIFRISQGLPYRDFVTVGVLLDHLSLKNKTKIKTIGGIVPDDWIYVHDRTVQMGRFQIYNNWSPYMVKDLEHTVWVGLEYFCSEGDSLWRMSEKEFSEFAVSEMVKMGLIDSPDVVLDTHMEKVKKAYPASKAKTT